MSLRIIFRLLAMVLPILCFANCGDDDPSEANLYIEKCSSEGSEFYTVKALSPGQNAGYGKNIFGENLGTVELGGKTYYAFKVKRKEYDIYVEWNPGKSLAGDFQNDRVSVNLKINDWVKLSFRDAGNYRAFDGTGKVY